jgi:hypothetical protein
MADDRPTLASSYLSVSNHNNKSQAVRAQRISATSRSKIVTRPRTLSFLWLIPPTRADFRLVAAQLGRKMSLPRPQTLIMNFHLREARMAHLTHIALTCHNTPRQDQAANTAGSRSLVAAQCYHRQKCLGLSLLLHDWRGGLQSVLGFTTGTIAVWNLGIGVQNKPLRAR